MSTGDISELTFKLLARPVVQQKRGGGSGSGGSGGSNGGGHSTSQATLTPPKPPERQDIEHRSGPGSTFPFFQPRAAFGEPRVSPFEPREADRAVPGETQWPHPSGAAEGGPEVPGAAGAREAPMVREVVEAHLRHASAEAEVAWNPSGYAALLRKALPLLLEQYVRHASTHKDKQA